MSNERIDEIQELYDKCDSVFKIGNALFFINVVLTFILLFDFQCRDVLVLISLIVSILYVVIININELYFCNIAENERRKSLLKESFNVNTTLKRTKKYYNNKEEPSFVKLGLNCYESVFFTRNVVNKMIPINIVKITILGIVYTILMIKIENLDLLLVITQTIFSTEVVFSFIKLCYYKFQLDKISKDFENIFFKIGLSNADIDVLILDATMDYECLKSYCKISTSSKIFMSNNEEWSKEWKKLLKQIKK